MPIFGDRAREGVGYAVQENLQREAVRDLQSLR